MIEIADSVRAFWLSQKQLLRKGDDIMLVQLPRLCPSGFLVFLSLVERHASPLPPRRGPFRLFSRGSEVRMCSFPNAVASGEDAEV